MANETIQDLQNTLAFIREKKAARRLLTGPTNKAPAPETAATPAALAQHRQAMAKSQAILRELKASRPQTAKPAPAKPASLTPHLDTFNALKGAEATAYFKQHKAAIRAEDSARRDTPAAPSAVTAAEFLRDKRPTMTRSEFNKIPHHKRGEALKTIRLVD